MYYVVCFLEISMECVFLCQRVKNKICPKAERWKSRKCAAAVSTHFAPLPKANASPSPLPTPKPARTNARGAISIRIWRCVVCASMGAGTVACPIRGATGAWATNASTCLSGISSRRRRIFWRRWRSSWRRERRGSGGSPTKANR